MKNTYSIKLGAGAETPFEGAGVSSARITRKSLSADEFNFEISPDKSAQAIPYGTSVRVLKNSRVIFDGLVERAPAAASGASESARYTAKNAWSELEQIVYQQPWNVVPSGSADPESALTGTYKSRVILGQNTAGEKIGVAEQLRDILSYAISAGANLAVGRLDISSPMLFDEIKDLSCAEAVRRVLAWCPDAVSYFEYSAGAPLINIVKRSALELVGVDAKGGEVCEYSVSPREDLRVCGVCVKYEKTHRVGDTEWETVEEDLHPEGFNQRSKRALVMTVSLQGLSAGTQSNTIVCESIMPNSNSWWLSKFPAFDKSEFSRFSVKNQKRFSSLMNELKSGSVYDWMGGSIDDDMLSATLSYEVAGTRMQQDVSVRLRATNLKSGTYARDVLQNEAEEMPAGLAEEIYNACCALQYEGHLTLSNPDAWQSFITPKRLNITGARSEYAGMKAAVCMAEENLTDESVRLSFGPPRYLYPADITELFRINRPRRIPTDRGARVSARSRVSGVEIGGMDSLSDSTLGMNTFTRLKIGDAQEPSAPVIDLDPSQLPDEAQMKPREIIVCEDGELAYAHVMMTEPSEFPSQP